MTLIKCSLSYFFKMCDPLYKNRQYQSPRIVVKQSWQCSVFDLQSPPGCLLLTPLLPQHRAQLRRAGFYQLSVQLLPLPLTPKYKEPHRRCQSECHRKYIFLRKNAQRQEILTPTTGLLLLVYSFMTSKLIIQPDCAQGLIDRSLAPGSSAFEPIQFKYLPAKLQPFRRTPQV